MKLIVFLVLLGSQMAFASTEAAVKQLVLNNLKHTQNENLEATLAATKPALKQLFTRYDLAYKLLDFKYIGEDGEYAYAKIKQHTSKISGPAFNNNTLEALMVFKLENQQWKLWTQANLSITYD